MQVIFVALICFALAAVSVWQIVKTVYAIKTKGESLRPKSVEADDKTEKEE